VLDFDGTLVNLDTDWKDLRRRLGQHVRDSFGLERSFEPLDRDLFEIRRSVGEDAFRELTDIVSRFETEGYRGRKNTALLSALEAFGETPMAIFSSNCRRSILAILPDLHLSIGFLVAKEDVSRPKPDPEGLTLILQHFGVDAADALFIGDSNADMQAGAGAGVRTLWHHDVERLAAPGGDTGE
jgi:HAD superfamily hydrolase (TIGR01549 family)